MLQQLAARNHRGEALLPDEEVVLALRLARARRPRGRRDRQQKVVVAVQQAARDRRLAGAGGRGEHQHETAALDVRLDHGSYSMFWICSRSCSIDDLRSRPMSVRSTSTDLATRVLATQQPEGRGVVKEGVR